MQLTQTATHPDAIALDDAFVYFHDGSGIARVQKLGGEVQRLASAPATLWPNLVAFALAGGQLFFEVGGGSVGAVATTGGAMQVTATGLGSPLAFAASATLLYYWTLGSEPSPILRMALDGSGQMQVDYLVHVPNEALLLPPEHAYFACDPGVRLVDYSVSPGGTDLLLSGLSSFDLATNDADVYFTPNDGTSVRHLQLGALATTEVADTAGAFALALWGRDLLFTDRLGQRIKRVVGATSPVIDVLGEATAGQPIDIAVDDHCIYYSVATSDGGAIMAAPQR